MRSFIGWLLILAAVPYTAYTCFHPEHAIGPVSLVIVGGIFLRRARDDRDRRLRAVAAPRVDTTAALAPPRLPSFVPREPVEEPAVEAVSVPPPAAEQEPSTFPAASPTPATERRDEICPPPLPKQRTGTVLRLVHSDGKRADVRDFRHRKAN